MANIYVNDTSSSSTDQSNGQSISQSSTYTVLVDNNYTATLNINVWFYTGTGLMDTDASLDGQTVLSYTQYSNGDWEGPHSYLKTLDGSVSYTNAAVNENYISAVKLVVNNVPDSTKIIGVEYYDGSSWSSKYYWLCEDPTPDHYTIRCYINGEWQDCVINYFDGTNWIECIAQYYDGSGWQPCSF